MAKEESKTPGAAGPDIVTPSVEELVQRLENADKRIQELEEAEQLAQAVLKDREADIEILQKERDSLKVLNEALLEDGDDDSPTFETNFAQVEQVQVNGEWVAESDIKDKNAAIVYRRVYGSDENALCVSLSKKLGESVSWSPDSIKSVFEGVEATFRDLVSSGDLALPVGSETEAGTVVNPEVTVALYIQA